MRGLGFGCRRGGVRTWQLGMLPLVSLGDMTAPHLMGSGCWFERVGDAIKLKLIGLQSWLIMYAIRFFSLRYD